MTRDSTFADSVVVLVSPDHPSLLPRVPAYGGFFIPSRMPDTNPSPTQCRPGDLWALGDHRLLCGDSTVAADVGRLFGDGELATMVHADPPYGMRKSSVVNDHLTGKRLDAFQMAWWSALRPRLTDNASAYLWGNAADLWRLWYVGGLADSEPMTMRNEIVWDKTHSTGQRDRNKRMYPVGSERALFFVLGNRIHKTNKTTAAYWPGWEPIRLYLVEQRRLAGFSPADLKRICGSSMYLHWFHRSQWWMIKREAYERLHRACDGRAFGRPYDALDAEYRNLRAIYDGTAGEALRSTQRPGRAYFDNTHASMYDVWSHPSVVGDERHGMETPKPVEFSERAILSSTRPGEIVAVPFGGSGPEVVAAEAHGRRCRVMELVPEHCDKIIRRWETATGRRAVRLGGR